ncbi:hypothetical protein [Brevibacillus porteri]|uniref:DUF7210 family protein n=1 Tax=Brevibacillus porteri TaxID=2126350 RepID=UPI003D244BB7
MFDEQSIQEVVELVERGEITAKEALEIEKQGKNRKTLLNILERMIETTDRDSDDSEKQNQENQKLSVTLLKNIKYKRKWHKIGDEIEIDAGDRESLIRAEIIEE